MNRRSALSGVPGRGTPTTATATARLEVVGAVVAVAAFGSLGAADLPDPATAGTLILTSADQSAREGDEALQVR